MHVPMFDRVVARVPKEALTLAMLNQLRSYVRAREQEGWYYGNKAQFEARHVKIVAWLDALNENRK